MKKTPRTFFKLMCATVVPTVLVSSLYVNAEPGVLQNIPFSAVSTNVQSNILFILDDSGSMNFEIVRSDGIDDDYRIDVTPTFDTDLTAPLIPATTERELLGACSGFNTIYYDPTEVYEPWAGEDENGNEFVDQVATSARVNPYFTSIATPVGGAQVPIDAVGIVNLVTIFDGNNNAGYIPWQDDGDGIFQAGECVIDPTAPNFSFVTVASLPVNPVTTTTTDPNTGVVTTTVDNNTQGNFANWFTYHRSRSFTAKNSLLRVIESSRQRVGVAGLVGNVADGILIRDVDDIALSDGTTEGDARRAAAIANKEALMRSVASSRSGGGTPLGISLLQAGEFFREGGTVQNNFFDSSNPTYNTTTDNTISSTSPILNTTNGGTCQANYTILFSDGFANGGASVTAAVGNADSDDDTGNSLNTTFDGGNFADAFSGTLADVAMFYLERDLAPSITNNASIRDIRGDDTDFINHQHMSTYTIGFGVNGTLDRDPLSTETTFAWPQPQDLQPTSIDDMRHAAWNGRGRFLNSANPEELEADIETIFDDIVARGTLTTAASSVSSGFIQNSSLLFQAQFDPADFTGDLIAIGFGSDGLVDVNNQVFSSQGLLNTQVLGDNNISGTDNQPGFTSTRNIITKQINLTDLTVNTAGTTANSLQSGPGVAFAFDQLSTSQQGIFTSALALFPDWSGTDTTVFGTALVDFIRGDSTNEIALASANTAVISGAGEVAGERAFRDRNRRYLGAIVNSSPQFVGEPNELYPDQIEGTTSSELYSTFQTAQAGRAPIVYVGANDGMLHAFNASSTTTTTTNAAGDQVTIASGISGVSGTEVFAYIPAALTADLPQLAQPNFTFDSFVDSTPTIRDVYVNSDGGGDEWRTYLVSGLRNGARAIYALDVTDPESTFSNNASNANSRADDIARFEYTHRDLGFTYSRPQIARMNDGSWVAIVGNGYNSVGDGKAKLFIIDLETGLPLNNAGPTGSDGILDTGVGSIINNLCTDTGSDCNGLSEPTIVDLNGDFITDRIYAGDLHGNMWVFNVQSSTPSNWTVTKLFTATQSNCTVSVTNDCRQPITTRPVVSLHPSRRSLSTQPNILVLFGTGQFIAEGDASNTEDQSFYSVWDTTGISGTVTNANLVKANLVQRTFGGTIDDITVTGLAATYNPVAIPANPPTIPDAIPANFGWYIDLAGSIAPAGNPSGATSDPFDRGRVSINPIVSGSVVFFVSSVPSGEVVCLPGTIPGFLSALGVESGLTPDFPVFTDELGNPIRSSTIRLNSSVVGLGLDTTGDGKQTRLTNDNGSIDQDRVSVSRDIPSGRKAWSILR